MVVQRSHNPLIRVRFSVSRLRGGVMVTLQAHNLPAIGSNPIPATIETLTAISLWKRFGLLNQVDVVQFRSRCYPVTIKCVSTTAYSSDGRAVD